MEGLEIITSKKDGKNVGAFTGFNEFIDGFKNEVSMLKSRVSLATEKQLHMVWVKEGMLLYIPNVDDRTYIKQRLGAGEVRVQNDTFGSFVTSELIPNGRRILDMLVAFNKSVSNFFISLGKFFDNNRLFNKEIDRKMQTLNYSRMTRQVRFLCYGLLLFGIKPHINLFQFCYSDMTYEVLKFGAMYRPENEEYYKRNTTLVTDLYSLAALAVDGMSHNYIKSISIYNTNRLKNVFDGGAALCCYLREEVDGARRLFSRDGMCSIFNDDMMNLDLSNCVINGDANTRMTPIISSPTQSTVEQKDSDDELANY
jgi:hypothetical protein